MNWLFFIVMLLSVQAEALCKYAFKGEKRSFIQSVADALETKHFQVRYYQAIRKLHEEGKDLNALDEGGQALIHRAALAGDAQAVRALKRLGADIDVKNRSKDTASHMVALKGDADMFQLLADLGANMSKYNNLGWFPPQIAVNQAVTDGNVEMIHVLQNMYSYDSLKNFLGPIPLPPILQPASSKR